MNNRKIIIVAKCFDSSVSGPSNIVRGLIKEFEKENIPFEAVLLKENVFKWNFLRQVFRTFKCENKAVVNVHTDGFLIPLLVYFLSFCFRKHSYYLTVHGIYNIESKMSGKSKCAYVIIERFLYEHFPNLVCVSKMLQNSIADIFDRREKVLVIPNATDAASNVGFIEKEVLDIVSLGGLRKRKGIDYILELACAMKDSPRKVHFSIYGSSDNNKEWFDNEINRMNLHNMINYYGNILDKQRIYDVVKRADAQLCLSLYDTFNVAIAESLVLGCPCIASNMCGASYLINDGVNGIVVDMRNEAKNNYNFIEKYICSLGIKNRKILENNSVVYQKELSWRKIGSLYANLQ